MNRAPEHLLVHLRRAHDLIDRHYAEPLDLSELASAAMVSKFHFLRCSTLAYGKTPAAYLAERRIERAQDLLRATNLTVTEVCVLVGYTVSGRSVASSATSSAFHHPRTRRASPRRAPALRARGEARLRRANRRLAR
jgi:transcriptional regulator GlxA family with amidase domain